MCYDIISISGCLSTGKSAVLHPLINKQFSINRVSIKRPNASFNFNLLLQFSLSTYTLTEIDDIMLRYIIL